MANRKLRVEVDSLAEDTAPDFAADFSISKDTSATLLKRTKWWRQANGKGADIASAATLNLDNATGDLVDVTGTTAITAITLSEGRGVVVRFTGILTLTHGASLVLPNNGSNITTAAGDYAVFRGYSGGVVRCIDYQRANGQALVSSGGDVTGPASSTNLAIALFDGTTGKLLKNSLATINSTGSINIPDAEGYQVGAITLLSHSSGTGTTTLGNNTVTRTDVASSTNVYIKIGATLKALFTASLLLIDTASQLVWGTAGVDAGDTGLKRVAAGIVGVTNGSTGIGAINASHVVAAKTAAYTVLTTDCNTRFTNEGATARVDFSLPGAVAGLTYTFIVQDVDGIRVIAAAGDTIRINTSVSAAAGRIDATAIGSCVKLTAINATEWIAEYSIGTWTVT